MGDEKRFILFLILTMLVVVVTPPLFSLVFGPPPKPQVVKVNEPVGDEPEPPPADDTPKPDDKPPQQQPAEQPEEPALAGEPNLDSRSLGSIDPDDGFQMKVVLSNRGAAVDQLYLANFQNEDRTGPLQLLASDPNEPGSFQLLIKEYEHLLANRNWEILPEDPDAKDPGRTRDVVRFRTRLAKPSLVITKTYSLDKNSYTIAMDVDIRNSSAEQTSVGYRLEGPRGLVLEGAWYATKKRDAAIADGIGPKLNRHTVGPNELVKGAVKILQLADANDTITRDKWPMPPDWFTRFDRDGDNRLTGEEINRAANHLASGERSRFTERPVRLAGVDGQFFCVLLVIPKPPTVEARWDVVTAPVLRLNEAEMTQLKRRGKLEHADRSDVSVEIESRNYELAAGESLNHTFTIYAGPRKGDTLDLALNDSALTQAVINYQGALFVFPAALVSLTASTMLSVLNFFHSLVGNWGVAIIMLTVLVRLLMFPLSRKQAMSAVKMQALKPELDALREKYKNDKEKMSRAQMELWRKHKVNPLGGCLPLVIQMPIFIGLWQGLQSSVDLRHSRFLWIDNLAAPDGPSVSFFHWGENVPLVSWLFGPYFNLLPAILIVLFLIQQKLFMPPKSATPDPQMEMQQKMMTYMLVFFGYIFWRLPSGLCLYYIASTTWGIAERKLLPKLQTADPAQAVVASGKADEPSDRKSRGSGRDNRGNGRDARASRERRPPTLVERLQELLKKADKR